MTRAGLIQHGTAHWSASVLHQPIDAGAPTDVRMVLDSRASGVSGHSLNDRSSPLPAGPYRLLKRLNNPDIQFHLSFDALMVERV